MRDVDLRESSEHHAVDALPVGFFRFHADANLNFQLNRLASDGTSRMLDEVRAVAPKIRDFDDWARELFALADAAERERRKAEAMRYVRAAEFFLSPSDPRKAAAYERFVAAFEELARGRFERHDVPFPGGPLAALRLPLEAARGVVVVHGGFDSFLEEFFSIFERVRARGYEVVAFEGPGQGRVLHRARLPMTPAWHEPTGAVLDHFGLDDVTLVGISLGGCLALRAAAFEPRIRRVVAFDVLDDFFECVVSRRGAAGARLVDAMLAAKADRVLDALLERLARRDLLLRWGTEQGCSVTGARSPSAFLRETRRYTTRDVSARVTQDVLLLAGAEDHFVPLHQLGRQATTLVRARSVETRVFTADDHAASHCQIGNLALAVDTIARWIRLRSSDALD